MASTTESTKQRIHLTFRDDALSVAEQNARAANRTLSQELEYGYLEYVSKAGRECVAEHERKAAGIIAEQQRPDPGTTAAREHLREHARLGGMPEPTFEDPK
jgi:hypothetical protein